MDSDRELDELDRRIAEAMGWTDLRLGTSGEWIGQRPVASRESCALPRFSRSLDAAWSVVAWMWQTYRLGVALGGHDGFWWADFSVADCALFGDETGATPAEAISRAALGALADQGRID